VQWAAAAHCGSEFQEGGGSDVPQPKKAAVFFFGSVEDKYEGKDDSKMQQIFSNTGVCI